MITNLTVNHTSSLIKNLVERKQILTPKEGSSIHKVFLSSLPFSCENYEIETIANEVAETSREADVSGHGLDHTTVSKSIVDSIANKLETQINFIRTVVIPTSKDLNLKVNDALANFKTKEYLITESSVSDILLLPQIQSLLGDYLTGAEFRSFIPVRLFQPAIKEEDVVSLIITGNETIDSALANLLASKNEGWLVDVFNDLFTASKSKTNIFQTGTRANTVILNRNIDLEQAEMCIVGFLIANKLIDNPPDTANIGFDEYKGLFLNYKQQFALYIKTVLNDYDKKVSSGFLYQVMPAGSLDVGKIPDSVIKVYKENYSKFLSSGGSPEILIGNLLGSRKWKVNEVLAEARINEKNYQSLVKSQSVIVEQTRYQILKNELMVQLNLFLQDHCDTVEEIGNIQNSVSEYLNTIPKSNWVNIYGIINNVVCDYIYPEAKAKSFIDYMDEILAKEPDMHPKKAGYLATVNLITNWALAQIEIKQYKS